MSYLDDIFNHVEGCKAPDYSACTCRDILQERICRLTMELEATKAQVENAVLALAGKDKEIAALLAKDAEAERFCREIVLKLAQEKTRTGKLEEDLKFSQKQTMSHYQAYSEASTEIAALKARVYQLEGDLEMITNHPSEYYAALREVEKAKETP